MYGTPRCSRRSTSTRTLVVLPTPGPPLMIDTWRLSAVAIARRCLASSTISLASSARSMARSSSSDLNSGASTASSWARRSAARHSSSYSSRPYTRASSASRSPEPLASTWASSLEANVGTSARSAATSSGSGSHRPDPARRCELARGAVDQLGQRQVPVPLGAGRRAEHDSSAACRRNGEVGPMPSMTRRLSAVRKPIPWISSASWYGFSRTGRAASSPYASRTRLASAFPKPMWRSHESTLAIAATVANESWMTCARSGVMPLMTHSSSGRSRMTSKTRALDSLRRAHGTQVYLQSRGPEQRGYQQDGGKEHSNSGFHRWLRLS